MPRIRIFPYKQGSRSAAALAEALGGRVLKLEGSRYRYRDGDLVIGWGASETPFLAGYNTRGLAVASNKLAAFNIMQAAGHISIPRFWTEVADIPEDVRWPVVCRTVLNGHSGRGIVIANNRAELVPAPLYVEYVPKNAEYRVHVVRGSVIAIQQKRRIHEHANPDWQVRNRANGFCYARADVQPPDSVMTNAVSAVTALGLDFGAVDIIYNQYRDRSYVLEVNTAPGLEGQTVVDYATAFREIANAN